jgi:hypothetical protein
VCSTPAHWQLAAHNGALYAPYWSYWGSPGMCEVSPDQKIKCIDYAMHPYNGSHRNAYVPDKMNIIAYAWDIASNPKLNVHMFTPRFACTRCITIPLSPYEFSLRSVAATEDFAIAHTNTSLHVVTTTALTYELTSTSEPVIQAHTARVFYKEAHEIKMLDLFSTSQTSYSLGAPSEYFADLHGFVRENSILCYGNIVHRAYLYDVRAGFRTCRYLGLFAAYNPKFAVHDGLIAGTNDDGICIFD